MKRVMTLIVVVAMLAIGVPARAGAPTDQLKGTTDRILKLLQDPELKKPAKVTERRKQIRAVGNEIFDWEETAKRALARHWSPRTPDQRKEFSALFADLLERSYIGKIEAYSGERIAYTGESVEGDHSTVRTKLVTRSNTEVPIDYRMLKQSDRWRVYDVVIEGVSLIGNYRTQFNQVIQQSGYEGLVKKIKAKQEEVVLKDPGQGKAHP